MKTKWHRWFSCMLWPSCFGSSVFFCVLPSAECSVILVCKMSCWLICTWITARRDVYRAAVSPPLHETKCVAGKREGTKLIYIREEMLPKFTKLIHGRKIFLCCYFTFPLILGSEPQVSGVSIWQSWVTKPAGRCHSNNIINQNPASWIGLTELKTSLCKKKDLSLSLVKHVRELLPFSFFFENFLLSEVKCKDQQILFG